MWRNASPRAVAYWGGQRVRTAWGQWVEELYAWRGAVIRAIQSPGTYQVPNPPSNGDPTPFPVQLVFWVAPDVDGTPTLFMRLPALGGVERVIKYREPELRSSDKRPVRLPSLT